MRIKLKEKVLDPSWKKRFVIWPVKTQCQHLVFLETLETKITTNGNSLQRFYRLIN